MGEKPINLAKSVKDRLLNIARANGRGFDVVLVRVFPIIDSEKIGELLAHFIPTKCAV